MQVDQTASHQARGLVVHLANAHQGWVRAVEDLISVRTRLLGALSGVMVRNQGQIGRSVLLDQSITTSLRARRFLTKLLKKT
jgi:hypothetical protein